MLLVVRADVCVGGRVEGRRELDGMKDAAVSIGAAMEWLCGA